ncbi:hypothetical protein VNI00_017131 [Paramarasmius palmivorus]|uniref:Uncharacterized protein n=1 Tax=Paramarasmius palmivorus TaxID=297713 RepID=A0AAW0B7M2_9AGAR
MSDVNDYDSVADDKNCWANRWTTAVYGKGGQHIGFWDIRQQCFLPLKRVKRKDEEGVQEEKEIMVIEPVVVENLSSGTLSSCVPTVPILYSSPQSPTSLPPTSNHSDWTGTHEEVMHPMAPDTTQNQEENQMDETICDSEPVSAPVEVDDGQKEATSDTVVGICGTDDEVDQLDMEWINEAYNKLLQEQHEEGQCNEEMITKNSCQTSKKHKTGIHLFLNNEAADTDNEGGAEDDDSDLEQFISRDSNKQEQGLEGEWINITTIIDSSGQDEAQQAKYLAQNVKNHYLEKQAVETLSTEVIEGHVSSWIIYCKEGQEAHVCDYLRGCRIASPWIIKTLVQKHHDGFIFLDTNNPVLVSKHLCDCVVVTRINNLPYKSLANKCTKLVSGIKMVQIDQYRTSVPGDHYPTVNLLEQYEQERQDLHYASRVGTWTRFNTDPDLTLPKTQVLVLAAEDEKKRRMKDKKKKEKDKKDIRPLGPDNLDVSTPGNPRHYHGDARYILNISQDMHCSGSSSYTNQGD